MSRRAVSVLTALVLGGLAGGPEAWARADRQEAVRLARQARQHYDGGEYAKAIQGYEGAYRIVGRASLLFNIADCYERLGKLAEAVAYYRRYLAVCAPEKRSQVEKLIAAIRRRPATLMVVTRPEGAKVWINEKLQTWPTPFSVSVPPGKVSLRVVLPGYRVHRQQVTARPGAPLNLVVTLDKQTSTGPRRPAPTPGRRPSPWERSAGFLGVAGGLKKSVYKGVDQPELNYSVTVSGGYGIRMGRRSRLELGLRLFVSTIDDGKVLTLLDVSALFGVRVILYRRLFLSIRAGVGLATMLGVHWDSFFFSGAYTAADKVPSSYAAVQLWGALSLGYRVWQRLSLVLTPVAFDYIPPVGHLKEDAADLRYILRYNFHLGLMVEL
ncbi:MAG: PEGA domain-containing protein [bacterium]